MLAVPAVLFVCSIELHVVVQSEILDCTNENQQTKMLRCKTMKLPAQQKCVWYNMTSRVLLFSYMSV